MIEEEAQKQAEDTIQRNRLLSLIDDAVSSLDRYKSLNSNQKISFYKEWLVKREDIANQIFNLFP